MKSRGRTADDTDVSTTDARPGPTAPRPLWRRPLLVAEAAALAVLGWIAFSGAAPGARIAWRNADSGAALAPLAEVAADLPLRLDLDLTAPRYVYVASHDLVRGTIAWFPSTFLKSATAANPLPAGRASLPGRHLEHDLRWPAGDAVGPVTVVTLLSERPLPELEAALTDCRQLGNAAFPSRAMLGVYAPRRGMESTPPVARFAHPLLEVAAALPEAAHDGPAVDVPGHPGVQARVLRLRTPLRQPLDREALHEHLRETIGTPLPEIPADTPAGPPAPPPNAGR